MDRQYNEVPKQSLKDALLEALGFGEESSLSPGDFMPGIGEVRSLNDAYRAMNAGDTVGTGLGLFGAIPLVGAIGKAGKAANAALDMSKAAREARAAEMGFLPETFYHGTKGDIDKFKLGSAGQNYGKKSERAIFLTDNPLVAEQYADAATNTRYDDIIDNLLKQEKELLKSDNIEDILKAREIENKRIALEDYAVRYDENIMPLRVAPKNILNIDAKGAGYDADVMRQWLKSAKEQQHDVVSIQNFVDGGGIPSRVLAVLDPKLIRSSVAKFDPSKSNSADLLAGLAGTSLLTSALLNGGLENE